LDQCTDVNVRTKIGAVIATMFQDHSDMIIDPWKDDDDANPLQHAKDLPYDEEGLGHYVQGIKVFQSGNQGRRSSTLVAVFRVRARITFGKLKRMPNVWNHLKKFNVFIDKQTIPYAEVTTLGYLKGSHPTHTHVHDLKSSIKAQIPPGVDFDLVPRTIRPPKGSTKEMRTQGLALVASSDHTAKTMDEVLSALDKGKEQGHLFSGLQLVPFEPSGALTTEKLEAAIIDQNRFLNNCVPIAVYGFIDLEVNVRIDTEDDFEEMTIREFLLKQQATEGKLLFHSIQRASNGRYFFIANREARTEATKFIDNLQVSLYDMFDSDVLALITSPEIDIARQDYAKTVTSKTATYYANIAASIASENPQDDPGPAFPATRSQAKVTVSYGKTIPTTTEEKDDKHGGSYAKAAGATGTAVKSPDLGTLRREMEQETAARQKLAEEVQSEVSKMEKANDEFRKDMKNDMQQLSANVAALVQSMKDSLAAMDKSYASLRKLVLDQQAKTQGGRSNLESLLDGSVARLKEPEESDRSDQSVDSTENQTATEGVITPDDTAVSNEPPEGSIDSTDQQGTSLVDTDDEQPNAKNNQTWRIVGNQTGGKRSRRGKKDRHEKQSPQREHKRPSTQSTPTKLPQQITHFFNPT